VSTAGCSGEHANRLMGVAYGENLFYFVVWLIVLLIEVGFVPQRGVRASFRCGFGFMRTFWGLH
jgi:hypothetical protein